MSSFNSRRFQTGTVREETGGEKQAAVLATLREVHCRVCSNGLLMMIMVFLSWKCSNNCTGDWRIQVIISFMVFWSQQLQQAFAWQLCDSQTCPNRLKELLTRPPGQAHTRTSTYMHCMSTLCMYVRSAYMHRPGPGNMGHKAAQLSVNV